MNLCKFGVALVLWLGLGSAQALVEGPWVETDPARYRMIAAEVDGTPYAALQIEMKPGWHTYWRYPGASGLEPQFDFADSRGIEAGAPIFPAPYFFDDGVGGFNGYKDNAGFVFPLTMQPSGELSMRGLIGVCREVCVPMEIAQRLVFNRDGLKSSPHKQAIAALLQARPQEPSPDLIIRSASFDGVSIQLVVSGAALETVSVITVPGPHDIIGLPRIVGRDEDAFLLEIPAWSKLDHPLIGRKLTFIVRDGDRAIEQKIQLRDHRLLPQEPIKTQ